MASISISCTSTSISTVSCTNYALGTSQQAVAGQCVSRRSSGGWFVDRDGRGFADVVLRQSSKTRIVGWHSRRSLQQQLWRVDAGLKETALTEEKWGPPITLGTAQLPQDVDLKKLQTLLYQSLQEFESTGSLVFLRPVRCDTNILNQLHFDSPALCTKDLIRRSNDPVMGTDMTLLLYVQWGTNLTQNANLPLPVPLKVDRIEGGVRLGYIRVIEGKVEDLVHIDVIVTPKSDDQPKAMFRAIRNGQMKGSVPPGEPLIMQSLLAALKISLPLARTS